MKKLHEGMILRVLRARVRAAQRHDNPAKEGSVRTTWRHERLSDLKELRFHTLSSRIILRSQRKFVGQ